MTKAKSKHDAGMEALAAKWAEQDKDKLADAKRQGQAQFDSIKEMVQDLECAASAADPEADTEEQARQRIHEDALSVQVRSDWYQPGTCEADRAPAEYEILLCTGGPACRIIGELSQHGEPTTARLEVQDWFQPWTQMRPLVSTSAEEISYDSEPILLAYAGCFYFGEG